MRYWSFLSLSLSPNSSLCSLSLTFFVNLFRNRRWKLTQKRTTLCVFWNTLNRHEKIDKWYIFLFHYSQHNVRRAYEKFMWTIKIVFYFMHGIYTFFSTFSLKSHIQLHIVAHKYDKFRLNKFLYLFFSKNSLANWMEFGSI